MVRYFQHLNPDKPNFKEITQLDFIDNSDPSITFYNFTDGTCCNPEFIGKLNDDKAFEFKKEMAEISDPNNAWKFNSTTTQQDVKHGVTKDGESVIAADPFGGGNIKIIPIHIPTHTNKVVSDEPFYLGNENEANNEEENIELKANDKEVFDFENEDIDIQNNTEEIRKVETPTSYALGNQKTNLKTAALANISDKINEFILDEKEIYRYRGFKFIYQGKTYEMSKDEFIKKLINVPEKNNGDKTSEKLNLPLKIKDEEITLLENMINMAKKDECEIEMGVTLKIPSQSLYNLIANDYPEGMSEAFIRIIANKIKVLDLKSWVAGGLNAYYGGEIEIEEDQIEVPEPEPEPIPEPTVHVKSKKAVKKSTNK